jgi:small GTP-binding protein
MLGRNIPVAVKIVIIGNSGTGKTSLLMQLTQGIWEWDTRPTLGIDFMVKQTTIGGSPVELQLWDTAGQEVFRSITRGYYHGAAGVLIVFDLTSDESFQALDEWYNGIRETAGKKVAVILIGNKLDLLEDESEEDKGEAFARSHEIQYFRTSAKTGENLDAALRGLEEELARKFIEFTPQQPEEAPRENACKC